MIARVGHIHETKAPGFFAERCSFIKLQRISEDDRLVCRLLLPLIKLQVWVDDWPVPLTAYLSAISFPVIPVFFHGGYVNFHATVAFFVKANRLSRKSLILPS